MRTSVRIKMNAMSKTSAAFVNQPCTSPTRFMIAKGSLALIQCFGFALLVSWLLLVVLPQNSCQQGLNLHPDPKP